MLRSKSETDQDSHCSVRAQPSLTVTDDVYQMRYYRVLAYSVESEEPTEE